MGTLVPKDKKEEVPDWYHEGFENIRKHGVETFE